MKTKIEMKAKTVIIVVWLAKLFGLSVENISSDISYDSRQTQYNIVIDNRAVMRIGYNDHESNWLYLELVSYIKHLPTLTTVGNLLGGMKIGTNDIQLDGIRDSIEKAIQDEDLEEQRKENNLNSVNNNDALGNLFG